MKNDHALDTCRTYINSQLQSRTDATWTRRALRSGPAITLSRQTGSGARTIADLLAAYLDKHGPAGKVPWTVFDRTLVDKVLEEHRLPKVVERYMPEDRRSYIDETMEELLGLHPPAWTLVRQVTETVLHLAEMGRVILVGRGAHIITARALNTLHVRLIAPLEQRIENIMRYYQMPRKEAVQFIRKTDRGRARYLENHFQCDIDDNLHYHLLLNTGRFSMDEAARFIGEVALRQFQTP